MNAQTALLFSLLSTSALAQDDHAAGLFTRARQLPLVTQTMSGAATDAEATLTLTQQFANDGPDLGQAEYRLHLPQGATIVSFAFWDGKKRLEASLKERSAAESAHRDAAARGRSTGLLTSDATTHVFSVYPVREGELKQVEVVFRLPVEREMGRSRVRLPIDSFLGQSAARGLVVFRLTTGESLADVGVEGARFRVLQRAEKSATLVFTSRRAAEVVWHERAEALVMRAEAVEVEGGKTALGLRVVLNDAGAWAPPYRQVHVLADASFSMRKRAGALADLFARVQAQSPVPVRVHAVAERTVSLAQNGNSAQLAHEVLSGAAGHVARWGQLAELVGRLECRSKGVRCIVVTDPLLAGLDQAPLVELGLPVVFLADAPEVAWAQERLPAGALIYQPESEPLAKLHAIVDQVVLPVLDVRLASQASGPIDLGQQRLRVAEGGMLRLFAEAPSLAPVEVDAIVGDRPLRQRLDVRALEPASEEGKALRRGYYAKVLADWMAKWKEANDEKLKREIIELSLREKIPTAFTALQVDAPELSLADIKPGDPLLRVKAEPGLEEVVAWYPFGEVRRLVKEGDGAFIDRFLVPRFWAERVYSVEIFKRYADGSTRAERAFYRLDEEGPDVSVRLDEQWVRIVPGPKATDLSTVSLHREDGRVLALSALGDTWLVPRAEAGARFTVVARDRAGNRTSIPFPVGGGQGEGTKTRRAHAPHPTPLSRGEGVSLQASGRGISVDGRLATVEVLDRRWTFSLDEAPLRSLDVTASLSPKKNELLFGTQGGDLVHLRCTSTCTATALGRALAEHPVTGLASLDNKRVLVGALGLGLYELRGSALTKSKLQVGSAFITDIATDRGDVLVSTAYNGLWRIAGGKAVKTLLSDKRALALTTAPDGARVWTGERSLRVLGRDRFVPAGVPDFEETSRALTSSVEWNGTWYVGGFDRGLFQLREGKLTPVDIGLSPREAQVNALLAHDESLWLGTEAGLLRYDGAHVERVHPAAVHDLASCPQGVVAATPSGLWAIDGGEATRLDFQKAGNGKFLSVACTGEATYAGNLEGLFRFANGKGEQLGVAHGFDAGWVTALHAMGDRIIAGTYDAGVFVIEGSRASRMKELAHQWVPPRAIRSQGDTLWIGGIGMAPVRVDERGVFSLPIPARDVNDFIFTDGAAWLLTSEGLLRFAKGAPLASLP
ncbi:MAG: VIT domain-containing protein [Myxococcota bacterium]